MGSKGFNYGISQQGHRPNDLDAQQAFLDYRADPSNHEAFARVVHTYRDAVLRYLQRLIGDAHTAEDACQQTFANAAQKSDQYKKESPLRQWLYGIAYHQLVDAQRRNKRWLKMVSLDTAHGENIDIDWPASLGSTLLDQCSEEPNEILVEKEDAVFARELIAGLPDTQRAVIELQYLKGMTHTEIARALRIPLGTVKTRSRIGLKSMRNAATALDVSASSLWCDR